MVRFHFTKDFRWAESASLIHEYKKDSIEDVPPRCAEVARQVDAGDTVKGRPRIDEKMLEPVEENKMAKPSRVKKAATKKASGND